MTYLLDTNAAIALLKEHPQMLHHVRRVGRSTLRVCAPVEAELWFRSQERSTRTESRPFAHLVGMVARLTFCGSSDTAMTSEPICPAKAHGRRLQPSPLPTP